MPSRSSYRSTFKRKSRYGTDDLVTKGSNNSDSTSRIVIDSGGNDRSDKYSINTDELSRLAALLANNAEVPIKSLEDNSSVKGALNSIKNLIAAVQSTTGYPAVYGVIMKEFRNVKTATPGTIGGYFMGCLINSNTPSDACSLACVEGLQPPGGHNGFKKCDHLVIVYKNGRFETKSNGGDTTRADLYVSQNFNGFNKGMFDQLNTVGIKSVRMNYVDGSDRVVRHSDTFIPIANLPQSNTSLTPVNNNSNNNNNNNTPITGPRSNNPGTRSHTSGGGGGGSGGSGIWGFICFVIIIGLIIALVWWLLNRNNNNKDNNGGSRSHNREYSQNDWRGKRGPMENRRDDSVNYDRRYQNDNRINDNNQY